jgi:VanZ family protein
MTAITNLSNGPIEVPMPELFSAQDKAIHFLVYGLLATTILRVPPLANRPRLAPWYALMVASLFGMSDEIHQGFVPGRSMDILDWLADTTGATLAAFLYRDFPWYRRFLELRLFSRSRPPLSRPPATTPTQAQEISQP